MAVIAGIVLAAGSSLRMGEMKQLLPFRDQPMLQHVVTTAEASALTPLVIVTGADGERIAAAIRCQRATLAHNPDHAAGNMSSLAVGVAAAEADAYVILMGDQPTLDPSTIDEMVALWHDDRPWGAVTEYEDRIGHPFLLSGDAARTAITTSAPRRLWSLLTADEADRVTVVPAVGSAPIDVNTPEDYQRLITES